MKEECCIFGVKNKFYPSSACNAKNFKLILWNYKSKACFLLIFNLVSGVATEPYCYLNIYVPCDAFSSSNKQYPDAWLLKQ